MLLGMLMLNLKNLKTQIHMKQIKVIMIVVAVAATLSAITLSWCSFTTEDGEFFSKMFQTLFILLAVVATREATAIDTDEED